MRWLLACRQSYAEGLDILYHTNTIRLHDRGLISDFPRYILPQRISAMASLEIVLLIDTTVQSGKSTPKQNDLNKILSILDLHFPRLQRLNLSLKLRLYKKFPVELDEMIKTLDLSVACRAQHLAEPMTVSLGSWAFEQLHAETVQIFKEEKGLDSSNWLSYKLWRYLDGTYDIASAGSTRETYGRIEGITARNGYWIRRGDDPEKKITIISLESFGSGGTMITDEILSRLLVERSEIRRF